MKKTPLVLMILDGWGHRAAAADNAISLADTPNWDALLASYPHSLLQTSGTQVGLPDGQMGNSEVGHMNIGAGRIVYQDFSRIENALQDGSFQRNPALLQTIDAAVAAGGAVHVMGLLSAGGVHSHERHLLAAAELAAERGARQVFVHAFLDGRDTPPRSAAPSLEALQDSLAALPAACIATLCGRYYAMDRDQRWERVQQAWQAMVAGQAPHQADTASEALQQAYARGENDEFVAPTLINSYPGMADGDGVLFINFRADRAREITQAMVLDDFDGFSRRMPALAGFTAMTEYQAGLPVAVAFPPEPLPDLLGEVLARAGLRQLRIAETEKYAHVTFFFNGGREQPFAGEQRTLIPSPKVATYDQQPEMSAPELGEALCEAICSGQFEVIICNVANPDMVGHTGYLQAAIKAVEAVDHCLGTVCEALDRCGGELLVTADHGNVEQMQDPHSGQAHTAHTTNPVPLVYRGRPATLADGGSLRDLAPTMLQLLGLAQPAAMTGSALVQLHNDTPSAS
jgi:2,3-bisphosphoglycerate-independent phosphoglycerate mutase